MPRETRLYSLFQRNPQTGKWDRVSELAYRKTMAVRIFQTRLLNGTMMGHEMALKPVAAAPRTGQPVWERIA